MPRADDIARLLPLVREYGQLERKRTDSGVTPEEYLRWTELRSLLEEKFPQGSRPPGANRRAHLRLPTRMRVEFQNKGELEAARIRNISRGGVFIATSAAPPVGSTLELLIRVAGSEPVMLPVEVVSTGIPGPGAANGIGCKFARLDALQKSIVDQIFVRSLDEEV